MVVCIVHFLEIAKMNYAYGAIQEKLDLTRLKHWADIEQHVVEQHSLYSITHVFKRNHEPHHHARVMKHPSSHAHTHTQ